MESDQMLTDYVMINDLKKGDVVKDYYGGISTVSDNKKGMIRNIMPGEGLDAGERRDDYMYHFSHVKRDGKWLPLRFTKAQGSQALKIAAFMDPSFMRRIKVMTLEDK